LLFRIVPEESEVRFKIDEDLRGRRVTVVGATNQVAGDILIDRVNPPNSQIGTIRINVRTLQTDSGNRDRAIRSFILESARDEYEFSDFVPTAIENMPTSVEVGTPFEFLVIGDLTLRGQTRQVTFNVTVTPISEERIEGQARAQVLYKDFGLSIPEVPGVANISDEVKLEIDFVAVLVAE
jgi:polyisoprenoid-binding protein YceI